MKIYKRFGTTCCLIFMCLCAPFLSSAGNSDSLLAHAHQLMANRDFDNAAVAYEYAVYRGGDQLAMKLALLNKARCQKLANDFASGRKTLLRIDLHGLPDSSHFAVSYEMALLAYLDSDFETAENQLKQLDAALPGYEQMPQTNYLRVLVLSELQQWQFAHDTLNSWIKASGFSASTMDSLLHEADLLFSGKKLPRFKNYKTAKTLSAVLPGTGQFYAGYAGRGSISLVTALGLLGYVGGSLYFGQYFTAVTVGASLYHSWASGGVRHTRFLVEKRNFERLRAFNGKVKALVVEVAERTAN